MLRSKLVEDKPEKCLTLNVMNKELKFRPTQKIEVSSCISSLYHGDGREIFIMGNSGTIQSKVLPLQCISV